MCVELCEAVLIGLDIVPEPFLWWHRPALSCKRYACRSEGCACSFFLQNYVKRAMAFNNVLRVSSFDFCDAKEKKA